MTDLWLVSLSGNQRWLVELAEFDADNVRVLECVQRFRENQNLALLCPRLVEPNGANVRFARFEWGDGHHPPSLLRREELLVTFWCEPKGVRVRFAAVSYDLGKADGLHRATG